MTRTINTPRPGFISSNWFLLTATLITLLGAAVRINNLGFDSLWFDEVLTLNTAVQGFAAAGEVRDHPPLLYWLTSLSLNLFPVHEVPLRLPSLIAGILSVPAVIAFGKTTNLPAAGLWAALLLALSPFHVRYTQEARHYALLLFFALLSLTFLYQALRRKNKRDWLFYGLATSILLFVHYSAWLLFFAEGLLIGGWFLVMLRRRDFQSLSTFWPAVVPLLLALFLLLPPAFAAFQANSGPSAASGTTQPTDLQTWLGNAWFSFGFYDPILAAMALLLAAGGLLILAFRRRWLLLSFIATISLVPLAMIQILEVARWSLPKYIIYLLPSYLLAAGVSLETITTWLTNFVPWPRQELFRRLAISSLFCAGLLLLGLPRLQEEYNFMLRDWRGAIKSLGQPGDNNLVVAMALDSPDGFNAGGVAAPFYLPDGYQLLDGNHLDLDTIETLNGRKGHLSALFLNFNQPPDLSNPTWQISQYQGPLYLLKHQGPPSDLGEQLLLLYKESLDDALQPMPQCMLQQKTALIHLAREDYQAAQQALASVDPQCPRGDTEKARIQTAVTRGLISTAGEKGQVDQAIALAERLLAENPKDEVALETLIVFDLLDQVGSGLATITSETAGNPVQKRRFTMPHNGDWEEVLFMHPPASLSFTLELPEEATVFHFRNALAPESWDWGGDGVTFVATITRDDGAPVEIFRQHISNAAGDRNWHPAEIPLSSYAGETITLTLSTENGPRGDGTGDWAGWGAPRILRTSEPTR